MSAERDIFIALRESQAKALNESVEVEPEAITAVPTPETAEAVEEVFEESTLDGAEFQVLECSKCGIIGGAMNEEDTPEFCPICGGDDLFEAKFKVVHGQKKAKKVGFHKKRKLTPKQKAALAKARRKSHSASAENSRKKSMKLSRKLNDEAEYECPECGYEGSSAEFESEDGLVCPECGAFLVLESSNEAADTIVADDPKVDTLTESEYKGILESIGAPDIMFKLLAKGSTSVIDKYIENH